MNPPADSVPAPVRILVCDDHAVVRAGLLALLDSAPGIEVVGEAGTGQEALALAARLAPDVVLMDLQLGAGIDGVEATHRLTSTPATGSGRVPHVLVLTTYDTDADITRAIEAGATGYLLKAERPEKLFAVIHAAAARRCPGRWPAGSWPTCAARAPPSPTVNATSRPSPSPASATGRSPAPCSSARRR
ncbi:hypothetical protein GCM10010279_16030 [Streptomyces mutabilis]|nr:hypothetical protein GCM10010279_16030 [Streptomyces mutabilis]